MTVVRRPLAARAALASAVLILTAAGCTSGDDEPDAAPTPTVTSLVDLDPAELRVQRTDFCDLVAPQAVADALDGEPEEARTWGNGDRARVGDGVRDVVHEYGCAWSAGDRVARAWVFAPPVTAGQARRLAEEVPAAVGRAAKGADCSPVPGAAAYGRPSAAVRCQEGGVVTTTYAGRFGDAWLTCSLRTPAAPAPDAAARAERWCAAVAQAAAA